MEILVKSLDDEIRTYLEDNDNDISTLTKESFEVIKKNDFFLPFRYIYENLSLETILKKNPDSFENILRKTYPTNTYSELYKFELANPILVGIKKSIKSLPQKLSANLKKNGINHIDSLLDIEFFEFYKNQFTFLVNVLNKENELISPKIFQNPKLFNIVSHMKRLEFKDFNHELAFLGKDSYNLLELIDMQRDIIDFNQFTGFLDTEKIHIQLGLSSNNQFEKDFPILLYFGYGNHYPFTRQITQNNASQLRFNRINYLEANIEDIKQIKFELQRPNNLRNLELLRLIDSSQQNYAEHFKEHFSYEKRASEYKGSFQIDSFSDKLFMLPEQIRTKACALVAYKYFSAN